jgi:hypothetical protein
VQQGARRTGGGGSCAGGAAPHAPPGGAAIGCGIGAACMYEGRPVIKPRAFSFLRIIPTGKGMVVRNGRRPSSRRAAGGIDVIGGGGGARPGAARVGAVAAAWGSPLRSEAHALCYAKRRGLLGRARVRRGARRTGAGARSADGTPSWMDWPGCAPSSGQPSSFAQHSDRAALLKMTGEPARQLAPRTARSGRRLAAPASSPRAAPGPEESTLYLRISHGTLHATLHRIR